MARQSASKNEFETSVVLRGIVKKLMGEAVVGLPVVAAQDAPL